MSGNLQFRRGLKANLPTSAPVGMPLWCTDTKELYIGTGSSISKVSGSGSGTADSYSREEIDSLIGDIENLLSEV